MKNKLYAAFFASAFIVGGAAQGAVTVSIKNFSSATVGVPIVNSAGAAVPLNTIWASAGIFATTLPNWATATASQVLGLFTALDATPVASGTFTGLFTANDMLSGTYPLNFSGTSAYILVGNAAVLANSTAIAVYSTGSSFTAVDGAGNANVGLNATNAANWVYGITRSVTTQPTVTSGAYTTGVQLTSIPEPSAALLGALGALGLLRRRRI